MWPVSLRLSKALPLLAASGPIVGRTKITMGREGPPLCPGRENARLRVGSVNVNGLNIYILIYPSLIWPLPLGWIHYLKNKTIFF